MNASPTANVGPEDFLGLDVEVQRSTRTPGGTTPQHPNLFSPPPPGEPRVSTNTTIFPRSAVFNPASAAQPVPQTTPMSPRGSTPAEPPHRPHPGATAARSAAPRAHAQYSTLEAPAVPQHAPAPTAPSLAKLMQPTPSELAQPPRAHNGNSWLLALDDARAGRAGVEPVVHDPSRRAPEIELPSQLETSFAEAPPVSSRTLPWLVRGLVAAAAGSFLFVVGHTVLSPKLPAAKVEVVTPTAPRSTPVEPRAELADPGPARVTPAPETTTASARGPKNRAPKPVPQSPARPTIPEAIAPTPTAIPRPEDPPPTFIEIAPPEFAPELNPNGVAPAAPNAGVDPRTSAADFSLPPWYPGMVSTTPQAQTELAPAASELAGSPERKERMQRYLMQHSRGAAPLEDTRAEYVPPVASASVFGVANTKRPAKSTETAKSAAAKATAAASTPRPSSVWEGAVVPVDQIASKEQLLTPRVGMVRVTLASGDVKEGRLHAVGLGQIWLDRERGQEAIQRSRIERLEQVGAPHDPLAHPFEKTGAKTGGANGLKDPNARVRVRTAGGIFYGKIVSREGDSITLLSDDGSTVTIEGGSIESAPERKVVVKRDPVTAPPVRKPSPPVPSEPDMDPDFDPDDPHGGHRPPPPAPGS